MLNTKIAVIEKLENYRTTQLNQEINFKTKYEKRTKKEKKPRAGFEPATSSLPRTRYTPKPPRH